MAFVDPTVVLLFSPTPLFYNSILTEERLERLTKNIGDLDLELSVCFDKGDTSEEESGSTSLEERAQSMLNGTVETSQSSLSDSLPGRVTDDGSHLEHQISESNIFISKENGDDTAVIPFDPDMDKPHDKTETPLGSQISEVCDASVDDFVIDKQPGERRLPNAVLPLLRYQQYESSESSSRYEFLFSSFPKPSF